MVIQAADEAGVDGVSLVSSNLDWASAPPDDCICIVASGNLANMGRPPRGGIFLLAASVSFA